MKRRVLIVDDDCIICDMLKNLFEDKGYDVTTAFNASAALSKISKDRFDVVVTDLFLGDSTGIEVLKKVKRVDKLIPVVMITGLHDPNTSLNAFRHGVDDFILKPFSLEELIKRVENCMEVTAKKPGEKSPRYHVVKCVNDDCVRL